VGLAPSAVATLSLQAITTVAERAQQRTRFSRWLAAQRNKHYWRFFLVGFVAYILVTTLNIMSFNLRVIPLIMILSSALVPVTFVIFCWDEGAFADMPASTLGLAFLGGGVLSIVLVTLLYQSFGNLGAAPIMIGVIEETGKAAAVLWFLRDKRLRSELDGLVLGGSRRNGLCGH
jgi:RsiW-degrading membrane proteinase PrsW (M82 family)